MRSFYIIALALSLSATAALASGDPSNTPQKTPVLCEYYLTGMSAHTALGSLSKQIFLRPFPFSDGRKVKEAALKKLGLDFEMDHLQQHNLILSIDKPVPFSKEIAQVSIRIQLFDRGTLSNLFAYELPDSSPTLWHRIRLSDTEMKLSYAALADKFPAMLNSPGIENSYLGFNTDPDFEGIRTYASVHYFDGDGIVEVQVGVDVPCSRLAEFADPREILDGYQNLVFTNATTYCRVPVISFGRPKINRSVKLTGVATSK